MGQSSQGTTVAEPAGSSFDPAALLGGVGVAALNMAGTVGAATLFLGRSLARAPRRPWRLGLILEQMHFIGNRSVLIVVLTSAFTGLVLTLQGYYTLASLGAEQWVGRLVALSLTKELAPVLGALMVSARAGSAIAATLGNMRVTEQVDALKTMAIDPLEYLVSPRLIAGVIVGPMLTSIFTLVGLFVSFVFSVAVLGMASGQAATSIADAIEWKHVLEGLTKSLVFSICIVWVSTFRGYHASGGAKGVGLATTQAVVETSVVILGVDYVLTALMF